MNYRGMSLVGCTDLSLVSGKKLHGEVGVDVVVTSRKPMRCKVSTLVRTARDVGLIPTLGTIFPIFITPTTAD